MKIYGSTNYNPADAFLYTCQFPQPHAVSVYIFWNFSALTDPKLMQIHSFCLPLPRHIILKFNGKIAGRFSLERLYLTCFEAVALAAN